MESEITKLMESEENFADDTQLQIIELLQTKEGREILKKAIDHIRAEREETK